MKKIVIYFLLSTLILATPAVVSAGEIGVELRYWSPQMQGEYSAQSTGKIDFQDDLGFGNKEISNISLNFDGFKTSTFRTDFEQFKYDKNQRLEKNLSFAGNNYVAGSQVDAKLKLSYLKLGWLPSLSKPGDKWQVSGIVELKGSQIETTLGEKKKTSVVWLPTLGAKASTKINDSVEFYAEASGIPENKHGGYLDGEIGLIGKTSDKMTIIGGYRFLQIKAKGDDEYSKIDLKGPFVNLQWKF